MKTFTQRINWSTAALLALMAGLVVYTTNARPAAPRQPAIVASVDLGKVFDGLNERLDVDTRMTDLAGSLDAEAAALRETIEMLAEEKELFAPGSTQFQETDKQIAKKAYELRAFREFSVRKLELKKAQALLALHRSIKEGVAGLATERGYDLVLMNDSIGELTQQGTEKEMWAQISGRRILYATPTIDITQELIQRMNDSFAQGG